MIYTCTLNPSVDYIIHVADFTEGGLNRGQETFYYPGGKGINVSRVLKRLEVENTALGFLGGFTGDFITNELSKENINSAFIPVSGVTRINMKLKSNGETEINGPGAEVTGEQLSKLYDQIKSLGTEDYLVVAGSLPKSVPDNFYAEVAQICNENGVPIVVDTSSQALKEILGSNLFLVKPNHHELGELFDTEIDSIEDAVFYGKKLQQQGAKHVIVSMGGDGAVYIDQNQSLHANVPKGEVKNTVGAGDSMVSGFLAAYTTTNNPEEALRFAVATGSATAFSEDLCTKKGVEKLIPEIKIRHIK